jgi:4-hydroxy-3-methylbut-2-enyl diphosphate reductase
VDEVAALPEPPEAQLTYLTQTTLSVDETADIVAALRARFPRLADPPSDDICYATQNRQDAIKVIAPRSDVVFVIGSRSSSNTRSLRQVAESLGKPAYLIGSAADITPAMLAGGVEVIGLTSGASAPESQVQQIVDELRRRGVTEVEEVTVRDEFVSFVPPRELITLTRLSLDL